MAPGEDLNECGCGYVQDAVACCTLDVRHPARALLILHHALCKFACRALTESDSDEELNERMRDLLQSIFFSAKTPQSCSIVVSAFIASLRACVCKWR